MKLVIIYGIILLLLTCGCVEPIEIKKEITTITITGDEPKLITAIQNTFHIPGNCTIIANGKECITERALN